MNRRKRLATFLTILTALCIPSCGEEQAEQEVIRPVRYQQVFLAGGEQTRTFSGISKAGTEADLSFRVGGNVRSINVKVGNTITRGAPIASIDDSDASLQYEQALVSLEKSRIQKETAKSNLNRVKGLYENNNVSLNDYETAKANYASASSAFDSDKRSADLKESALSYYRLFSPMDGIVTQVNVEEDENVQAGQVMAVVNAGDDIEVTVGMPESFISKVRAGEPVSVEFPSIPDKSFDGEITEVSYSINSQSSTYPVTVALSHPTQEIRPGMPGDVTFRFIVERATDNFMVPANAVGEDRTGRFVFTVTPANEGFGIIHRKRVTVGKLTREGFEILSGLQDGDLVVTAGIADISDGMKVRLL